MVRQSGISRLFATGLMFCLWGLAPLRSHGLPFGNGHSYTSVYCISGNGRYVVFESSSSNLVLGDTNGTQDVFRWEVDTGTVIRVSVSSTGAQGNNYSVNPSINYDGNLVAFSSLANNLVPGDTNSSVDIFVRDIAAQTTTRVNVDNAGNQASLNSSDSSRISFGGNSVAFSSTASNLVTTDTNGVSDVFVRDLVANTTTRVSVGTGGGQANGASMFPALSSDGSRVIFVSSATNLTTDTNGVDDLFLRDLNTGTTTRVNVSSSNVEANAAVGYYATISADGNRVAFFSSATNLISGDTNSASDVFLRDISAGTTTRVSLTASGAQANFGSYLASISGDGNSVAFDSDATNLVTGDTNGLIDTYVRKLTAPTTIRANVSSAGAQATGGATSQPSLSADGTRVSFYSLATNLVPGDTNGLEDVFLRDIATGTTYGPGAPATAAQDWNLFD